MRLCNVSCGLRAMFSPGYYFAPDSRIIAFSDGNGATALFDCSTGAKVRDLSINQTPGIVALAWHCSSKFVAVFESHRGHMQLFSISDPAAVCQSTQHRDILTVGRFDATGRRLAVAFGGGQMHEVTVVLYDFAPKNDSAQGSSPAASAGPSAQLHPQGPRTKSKKSKKGSARRTAKHKH